MVSEVNIIPVKPRNGLVAFASVVINDELYIGSIAVYTRLSKDGYRLVYPSKQTGNTQMNVCHPTTRRLSDEIELAVADACNRILAGGSKNDRHSKAATEPR